MQLIFKMTCASLLIFLLAQIARADELSTEDFSLRFPAALSRYPSYGDTAGLGGASAASPWTSSANPAALCWETVAGKYGTYSAIQYAMLDFENGSEINVIPAGFVLQTESAGTWSLAAADVDSNQAQLNNGIDFEFESSFLDAGWSSRCRDETALGIGVRFTEGKSTSSVMGFPVAEADSPGWQVRLGILHQVCTGLLAGVVVEGGRSDDEITLTDPTAPEGPPSIFTDPLDQLLLRAGTHWTYSGESALYTDLQVGEFRNDTGSLQVVRLSGGIEQNVAPGLFLRAGALSDLRWNETGWTTGIGFYPNDRTSLDVAFMKDMYPELEPEFGGSESWVFSFSLSL